MAIETILVGTDFSPCAGTAVDWAIELARSLGARVIMAHVFDMPVVGVLDASFIVDAQTAARISNEAQAALDAEVARVGARGVPVEGILRQGDPRERLPALASELGAGLLVAGSHGRRGLARALLGSVAESLVRTSAVPVVVVRSAGR